ncbi:hypothetical protein SJI45_21955 [Streptomyces sp. S399]|nr:hypothetical protein [Streptomyces sp. S399]WPR53315.1 hypothetical protein SJI45_21955 [Streptomyces sp. S399]
MSTKRVAATATRESTATIAQVCPAASEAAKKDSTNPPVSSAVSVARRG